MTSAIKRTTPTLDWTINNVTRIETSISPSNAPLRPGRPIVLLDPRTNKRGDNRTSATPPTKAATRTITNSTALDRRDSTNITDPSSGLLEIPVDCRVPLQQWSEGSQVCACCIDLYFVFRHNVVAVYNLPQIWITPCSTLRGLDRASTSPTVLPVFPIHQIDQTDYRRWSQFPPRLDSPHYLCK